MGTSHHPTGFDRPIHKKKNKEEKREGHLRISDHAQEDGKARVRVFDVSSFFREKISCGGVGLFCPNELSQRRGRNSERRGRDALNTIGMMSYDSCQPASQ